MPTLPENPHVACVKAWLGRVPEGAPLEEQFGHFELAFAAVWRRANRTLGEITLAAVTDRVLVHATDRFPDLGTVRVAVGGVEWEPVRARAARLPADQLREELAFMLADLLTVLGNVTADVLTPALHLELARLPPGLTTPDRAGSPGPTAPPDAGPGEGAR
jgi:hypothetical protein